MSSKTLEEIEIIAKDIHKHTWLSFLLWDQLSTDTKNEFRLMAANGFIYEGTCMHSYVPVGMIVKPHANTETPFKPIAIRKMDGDMVNIENPKEMTSYFNKLSEEQKKTALIYHRDDTVMPSDVPIKKKRGRPPGSKNKIKRK